MSNFNLAPTRSRSTGSLRPWMNIASELRELELPLLVETLLTFYQPKESSKTYILQKMKLEAILQPWPSSKFESRSRRRLNKEKTKLAKVLLKDRQKAKKKNDKLVAEKLRQKAEIFKEKQRVKAERQSCWPKKTHRVTFTLKSTLFILDLSRRSKISDDGADTVVNANSNSDTNLATTTFHEPSKVAPDEVSLSISYVTHSAFWSTRYNFSLDSVKCARLLEYGAQLMNTTSEIGLNEIIPTLRPWDLRFQKGPKFADGAIYSFHESQAKRYKDITSS
ncbi:hypothetical protein BJ878DRAFT_573939 [Calycina marina]|uniref:Uncharacterized protein n=1 Tax=Calycina marina TaxID=1763456 RepID=A0A9P7Z805_9HELO|nr:hypothetical protein BJ878DRAFT_573939 [Calycina marina]